MAEKYSTGNPCKRGHFGGRLASNRACCECQRDDNRARYLARREEIKAGVKAYRSANLEKAKVGQRAYRLAHLDECREKDRIRNTEPIRKAAQIARLNAWNKANPERVKQRVAAWAKANREKCAATYARYQAAKLRRTPVWADQAAILQVYERAFVLRGDGKDVHVDHILPLQGTLVSGLHVHANLQIIDAHENRVKSNHLLEET